MFLLYHREEGGIYTCGFVLRNLLRESIRVHGCKTLSNVSDVDGDVEIEQRRSRFAAL
jgi:hypothetical protein